MMLREIMSMDVLTASADDTVTGVAKAMTDRRVGSACVVEDDGSLVGIITERDVMRAAASGKDLTTESVRDWMTGQPITIGPNDLPSRVAGIMTERGFRHIPVLDEGELVGIVSLRDVWRFSFLPSEPDDMTLR